MVARDDISSIESSIGEAFEDDFKKRLCAEVCMSVTLLKKIQWRVLGMKLNAFLRLNKVKVKMSFFL